MIDLVKMFDEQQRGSDLMKRIFFHFMSQGSSTIPEISKALGYSVPAVTKHVIDLCNSGYILDHGKTENKEGRPANIYKVNASSCFFVGVTVQFHSLDIGIINLEGKIIKYSIDKSFRLNNSRENLEQIVSLTRRFIAAVCIENDEITRSKILNINFGISGRINPKTGYSFSLLNTGEKPLSEVLSEKLNTNVTIDNDARIICYGEHYRLRRKGIAVDNMLCLSVGYGIGMGVVIEGELYQGTSGYAGEFGHMSIFDNGKMCHCGKKGCLETETSGKYMVEELIKRIEEGSLSYLSRKAGAGRRITIHDFIDAVVKHEDPLCIEILEEVGFKLGRQIANMINLFNPQKIVISGAFALTGDYLLQPIRISVNKYVLTLVGRDTEIIASDANFLSSVVGSCLMSRDRRFKINPMNIGLSSASK